MNYTIKEKKKKSLPVLRYNTVSWGEEYSLEDY